MTIPRHDLTSHSQLKHLVSTQLRQAIQQGTLKPGQWLRQRQLAEEFNVSQMPVREALKELASEGLIEHIPYRGMRVIGFMANDVADLYAHRSFLEGLAARSAAQHIQSNELAKLEVVLAQMVDKLTSTQLADYRTLNAQFHQLIFEASRRPYLTRTLRQMWETFPTMLWGRISVTTTQSLPTRDQVDHQEHTAILNALADHDADTAECLMRTHIDMAGQELVAILHDIEQRQQENLDDQD